MKYVERIVIVIYIKAIGISLIFCNESVKKFVAYLVIEPKV